MFFNKYSKPGKGISKEDVEKTGISLYLDVFARKIGQIIKLNVLYFITSIPAIIISMLITAYFLSVLVQNAGINLSENPGVFISLNAIFATIFFQVTGSGPASVAKSYILRNFIKDKHVWMMSDFFGNIKRNFKQGITVYIINTFLITALVFSYIFYSIMWQNLLGSLFKGFLLMLMAIYVVMQLYVYQVVAGVELKVAHVYKNAILLAIGKLPWNILVVGITAIFTYILYSITLVIPILAVLLLVVFHFAFTSFTQIFMTNKFIEKYMIAQ